MRSREARALYIPLLYTQALVVPLLLRDSYKPRSRLARIVQQYSSRLTNVKFWLTGLCAVGYFRQQNTRRNDWPDRRKKPLYPRSSHVIRDWLPPRHGDVRLVRQCTLCTQVEPIREVDLGGVLQMRSRKARALYILLLLTQALVVLLLLRDTSYYTISVAILCLLLLSKPVLNYTYYEHC